MFFFDTLVYNNVVYYQRMELDLAYTGLTRILGHNKNAVRAKHRTNGSGKSLAVAGIPNLSFSSHPTLPSVGARGSGIKVGMVNSPKSSIEMYCHSNDGEKNIDYMLGKYGKKGGGVNYAIHKNGKNLKARTSTIAEQMISKIVPFTAEEFYTHTYLERSRQPILKTGTATERSRFFSSINMLDGYDYVKDECVAMRKELNSEAIRLEELKIQAADLHKVMSKSDINALTLELKVAKGKVDILKLKTDRLYKEQSDLKFYTANIDARNKLAKLGTVNPEKLKDADKELKLEIAGLDSKIALLLKYKGYKESLDSYQTRHKALKAKLAPDFDYRAAKTMIRDVDKQRVKLESEIKELKSSISDLERKLSKLDSKPVSDKQLRLLKVLTRKNKATSGNDLQLRLQAKLKVVETKHSTTSRLSKLVSNIEPGSNCFVCGTGMKEKHVHGVPAKLKQEEKKYGLRVKKLCNQIEVISNVLEYLDLGKQAKVLNTEIAAIEPKLNTKSKELKALPHTDTLEEQLEVYNKLKSLDKPTWDSEVPKGKVKELTKDKHKLLKTRALISTYLPISKKMSQLHKRHKGSDGKAIDEADRRYNQIQESLSKYVKIVARLEPEITNYESRRLELEKLEKRIDKSTQLVKDLPVLSMLAVLYSPKGLKIERLQERADLMTSTMNNYAGLLFHERMRFDFEIAPNRFDILATRGIGKKSKTSDVRWLSGAESGAFSLLTLWAMLKLVPSRSRSNICILDEMDGGLDPEGKSLYVNHFLPELNKIVPHIIVVTPLDDEYPNARTYVATKEGDVSTLVLRQ